MARRALPAQTERRVRQAARNRCGYCLSPQHLVMARLEIGHILPLTKGGSDDDTNLWLACPLCNSHKSDKTEAVDPLTGATVALSTHARSPGGITSRGRTMGSGLSA